MSWSGPMLKCVAVSTKVGNDREVFEALDVRAEPQGSLKRACRKRSHVRDPGRLWLGVHSSIHQRLVPSIIRSRFWALDGLSPRLGWVFGRFKAELNPCGRSLRGATALAAGFLGWSEFGCYQSVRLAPVCTADSRDSLVTQERTCVHTNRLPVSGRVGGISPSGEPDRALLSRAG